MKLHPMLIALGFGLLGCASPIVGAECAPGYTACDGRCVVVFRDLERNEWFEQRA